MITIAGNNDAASKYMRMNIEVILLQKKLPTFDVQGARNVTFKQTPLTLDFDVERKFCIGRRERA